MHANRTGACEDEGDETSFPDSLARTTKESIQGSAKAVPAPRKNLLRVTFQEHDE